MGQRETSRTGDIVVDIDVQNKGGMSTKIWLIQVYISFCGSVSIFGLGGTLFRGTCYWAAKITQASLTGTTRGLVRRGNSNCFRARWPI